MQDIVHALQRRRRISSEQDLQRIGTQQTDSQLCSAPTRKRKSDKAESGGREIKNSMPYGKRKGLRQEQRSQNNKHRKRDLRVVVGKRTERISEPDRKVFDRAEGKNRRSVKTHKPILRHLLCYIEKTGKRYVIMRTIDTGTNFYDTTV